MVTPKEKQNHAGVAFLWTLDDDEQLTKEQEKVCTQQT